MGQPRSKEALEAFLNPTFENAMKLWDFTILGPPAKPDAPIAGLHKARLKWDDATEEMKQESKDWLLSHGYKS